MEVSSVWVWIHLIVSNAGNLIEEFVGLKLPNVTGMFKRAHV